MHCKSVLRSSKLSSTASSSAIVLVRAIALTHFCTTYCKERVLPACPASDAGMCRSSRIRVSSYISSSLCWHISCYGTLAAGVGCWLAWATTPWVTVSAATIVSATSLVVHLYHFFQIWYLTSNNDLLRKIAYFLYILVIWKTISKFISNSNGRYPNQAYDTSTLPVFNSATSGCSPGTLDIKLTWTIYHMNLTTSLYDEVTT